MNLMIFILITKVLIIGILLLFFLYTAFLSIFDNNINKIIAVYTICSITTLITMVCFFHSTVLLTWFIVFFVCLRFFKIVVYKQELLCFNYKEMFFDVYIILFIIMLNNMIYVSNWGYLDSLIASICYLYTIYLTRPFNIDIEIARLNSLCALNFTQAIIGLRSMIIFYSLLVITIMLVVFLPKIINKYIELYPIDRKIRRNQVTIDILFFLHRKPKTSVLIYIIVIFVISYTYAFFNLYTNIIIFLLLLFLIIKLTYANEFYKNMVLDPELALSVLSKLYKEQIAEKIIKMDVIAQNENSLVIATNSYCNDRWLVTQHLMVVLGKNIGWAEDFLKRVNEIKETQLEDVKIINIIQKIITNIGETGIITDEDIEEYINVISFCNENKSTTIYNRLLQLLIEKKESLIQNTNRSKHNWVILKKEYLYKNKNKNTDGFAFMQRYRNPQASLIILMLVLETL